MFVGHFGVAFAAKRVAPRTNVAVAILATEFIDVLWPIAILLGIEKVRIVPGLMAVSPFDFISYPWTHSLLMSIVWGIVFGAAYYAIRRDGRAAVVMGAVVVSHWVLDFLTHRADMQLAPGLTDKYGLGLWNSRVGTYIVELIIYFGGLAIYARSTRAKDSAGRWGFISYATLLFVLYVVNMQGPPPPGVTPAVILMLASTVILLWWAWWFDRHREPVV